MIIRTLSLIKHIADNPNIKTVVIISNFEESSNEYSPMQAISELLDTHISNFNSVIWDLRQYTDSIVVSSIEYHPSCF